MFYNEEVKKSYIQSLEDVGYGESYIKRNQGIFNRVSKYEQKFGHDVSEFTHEEIEFMYNESNLRNQTIYQYTKSLRLYGRFVNSAGSAFDTFVCDVKEEQEKEKIRPLTHGQIEEIISKLKNPINKFLILGLFSGIKGPNFIELRYSSMEEANPETGEIWLAGMQDGVVIQKGRRFTASPELFGYAKEASETLFYYYNYADGTLKRRRLEQDGKAIYKDPLMSQTGKRSPTLLSAKGRIAERLTPILSSSESTEKYTPLDIYWSGVVFALKEAGIKKNIIIKSVEDLELLSEKEIEDIKIRFDTTRDKYSFKNRVERYL